MKKIKLHKKLPKKKILQLFFNGNDPFEENKTYYQHWNQYAVENDPLNEIRLRIIMSKYLEIDVDKINNIIAHVITGNVDSHADKMSNAVYLVPLRTCESLRFFIDENQKYIEYKFKPNEVIKFSDWHFHGVTAPCNSKNILLSIDT